jgi:hypothetical protein
MAKRIILGVLALVLIWQTTVTAQAPLAVLRQFFESDVGWANYNYNQMENRAAVITNCWVMAYQYNQDVLRLSQLTNPTEADIWEWHMAIDQRDSLIQMTMYAWGSYGFGESYQTFNYNSANWDWMACSLEQAFQNEIVALYQLGPNAGGIDLPTALALCDDRLSSYSGLYERCVNAEITLYDFYWNFPVLFCLYDDNTPSQFVFFANSVNSISAAYDNQELARQTLYYTMLGVNDFKTLLNIGYYDP